MGSDEGINKLSEVLKELAPVVKKLSNIDTNGELLSTLSKKDREEVEKFKNTSEVIKEAEAMAAKFNSGKWNL